MNVGSDPARLASFLALVKLYAYLYDRDRRIGRKTEYVYVKQPFAPERKETDADI